MPEKELQDLYLSRPENEKAIAHFKKLTLVVYEALESLEAVLAQNDSCPNLIFHIGYLKVAIGLEKEAVENFTAAIDKSDDNQPSHFIWKGIALCMNDNYEEALNEFRIALNIKNTCYQAALYKGRCYLHKKDVERAMYAFKDFIEGNPEEEQEIKYYLGNFFFHNGLPSHARQAYEEAAEIKPLERTLRELTKVYIVEKNLFLALEKLEILNEEFPHCSYNFDLTILLALRAASSQEYNESVRLLTSITMVDQPFIFSDADRKFYLGIVYIYLQGYSTSLALMTQAKEEKYPNGPNNSEEDIYLTGIFVEEPDDDSSMLGQTFTWLEINYNIALCHLKMKNSAQCIRALAPLCENERTAEKANQIVSLVEAGQPINSRLSIFPVTNRLCGIFEEKPADTPRLSFCLPSVKLPETTIKVGFEILSDLKITSVENRPEAPWIKRSEEGIVFTSDIISTEASEVRDVGELLAKIAHNKNEVMNTKIKLNAEKIFQSHHHKDLIEEEEPPKDKKLLQLKLELALDPKTKQALDKLTGKK